MDDGLVPAQYRSRVTRRLAIVEYADGHGIKPASRHFRLARRTVRTWLRRWKANGALGLVPQYPHERKRRLSAATIELIRVARTEYRWGAPRTRAWLEREHALKVNARTIQRVFRDIGMPVLTNGPQPSPVKAFDEERLDDPLHAAEAAL